MSDEQGASARSSDRSEPGAPLGARPGPKPSPHLSDHLANERTFLAWVRTSITIIALGFVVGKFGLLLRELAPQHLTHSLPKYVTSTFGTIIVLSGAGVMLLSIVHYHRTAYMIESDSYAPSQRLSLIIGAAVSVIAVVLAVYLLLSAG